MLNVPTIILKTAIDSINWNNNFIARMPFTYLVKIKKLVAII